MFEKKLVAKFDTENKDYYFNCWVITIEWLNHSFEIDQYYGGYPKITPRKNESYFDWINRINEFFTNFCEENNLKLELYPPSKEEFVKRMFGYYGVHEFNKKLFNLLTDENN